MLLLTNTSAPNLTPFLAISSILFNVALLTVTPANSTGSKIAVGDTLPLLPTFHSTSKSLVVASCASNLYAIAHLGNLTVYPKSSLVLISSIAITNPSIS